MSLGTRTLAHHLMPIGCALVLMAACGGGGQGTTATGGTGGHPDQGGSNQTGGSGVAGTKGSAGGSPNTGGTIGTGGNGSLGGSTGAGGGAAGTGGSTGGQGGSDQSAGGAAGGSAGGGPAGQTGGIGGGVVASSCVGKTIPAADPTMMGPFATMTDKDVGPLAGAVPDPIHMNMQSRFNVYRPKDLAAGGYCFPVIIWSNGHGDQPEPSAPECVLNKCGHYATMMQQFASHGFVVVVSMSSTTGAGDPLPSMVGLDWIIKQADDAASPYYHHLDTAHIGAAGHSEGGFATCKIASDPRISAISTVSGSSANAGIHQPTLFFCGEKDPTVPCSTVVTSYGTLTNVPGMLIDNLAVNHLTWASQGIAGPTISGLVAWFQVQLMGDTENRKRFYGPSCTFCTDNRVTVMRNALMTQ